MTCRLDNVSACHLAALTGGDALTLLLKFGAEKSRLDKCGRTPLHLAAYAGNARQLAILLDFPEGSFSLSPIPLLCDVTFFYLGLGMRMCISLLYILHIFIDNIQNISIYN